MSISARAKTLAFDRHTMWVKLEDGRSLGVPLAYFPQLSVAKPKLRKNYQIVDSGNRLRWDDLDQNISVGRLAAMTSLREFMECELKNWQSSLLPQCWREDVGDVCLNFDALDRTTNENEMILCDNIWPRGHNIFKAFHQVCPNDVRVVIFGNEPYSKACRSTGRAFEQGDISSFNAENIADSLRGLILAVLMTRCSSGALDGLAGCGELESQSELFTSWERQGVMWLNTSMTYSCEWHSRRHRKLWKPLLEKIIEILVNRSQDHPVIFVTWGGTATKTVKKILSDQCNADGYRVLQNAHPASYGCRFFADQNPLLAINRKLRSVAPEKEAITW